MDCKFQKIITKICMSEGTPNSKIKLWKRHLLLPFCHSYNIVHRALLPNAEWPSALNIQEWNENKSCVTILAVQWEGTWVKSLDVDNELLTMRKDYRVQSRSKECVNRFFVWRECSMLGSKQLHIDLMSSVESGWRNWSKFVCLSIGHDRTWCQIKVHVLLHRHN